MYMYAQRRATSCEKVWQPEGSGNLNDRVRVRRRRYCSIHLSASSPSCSSFISCLPRPVGEAVVGPSARHLHQHQHLSLPNHIYIPAPALVVPTSSHSSARQSVSTQLLSLMRSYCQD